MRQGKLDEGQAMLRMKYVKLKGPYNVIFFFFLKSRWHTIKKDPLFWYDTNSGH